MSAELTRWPRPEPPVRDNLELIFRDEGLSAGWWSSSANYRYSPHSHGYHQVLFCLAGGITFRIEPDGPILAMRPGDRLDIPPGTSHSAVVGREGVTCAEAPRRSATVPST